jgi:hypothetical protein
MNKYTKFLYATIFLLLLIVGSHNLAHAQTEAPYESNTDALVTDFKEYQTYGGKYSVFIKKITYNVFFPTNFGLDASSDVLEIMSSNQPGGYTVGGQNGGSGPMECTKVANGYNCPISWGLAPKAPAPGNYSVSFRLLDSTTHSKGRIFVPIIPSASHYAQTGDVTLASPLTSPYAQFASLTSNYLLSNRQSDKTMTTNVVTNSGNKATGVDYYLDGQLIGSSGPGVVQADSSYSGGYKETFNYTLVNLDQLKAGDHELTAQLVGVDGESNITVMTIDGKSSVRIVAAFTDNSSTCDAKLNTINYLVNTITRSESSQFSQIETINAKVQDFYSAEPTNYSGYTLLIKNIDTAKADAQAKLANLSSLQNFDCSGYASEVNAYINGLNATYAALNDYKNAIVNLINTAWSI